MTSHPGHIYVHEDLKNYQCFSFKWLYGTAQTQCFVCSHSMKHIVCESMK